MSTGDLSIPCCNALGGTSLFGVGVSYVRHNSKIDRRVIPVALPALFLQLPSRVINIISVSLRDTRQMSRSRFSCGSASSLTQCYLSGHRGRGPLRYYPQNLCVNGPKIDPYREWAKNVIPFIVAITLSTALQIL